MSVVKLEKFGGQLPAWDDALLPTDQASSSQNAYLYAGTIQGWRRPKLLHTLLNAAAKFAYRIPQFTKQAAYAYLFISVIPNDGDTVKIGEELYTFRTTVNAASAAYAVKIGATAASAASNLLNALSAPAANGGVLFGIGTSPNPQVSLTASFSADFDFGAGPIPFVYVQAVEVGAAFNDTVITESTAHARMRWLATVSSFTDFATTLTHGANETANTGILASSYWLEFEDPDTDVLRGPVADDTFNRFYYASPSHAPKYNTLARIAAGQSPWLLGVPAPGCSPAVTATGGGTAATIGHAGEWPGNDAPGINTVFLVKITPDGATQINSVSGVPFVTEAAAILTGIVYTDNAGAPHELIGIGAEVLGVTDSAVFDSAFQIPIPLSANTSYWIGFHLTGADFAMQVGQPQDSSGVKFNQGAGDPPDNPSLSATGQPAWRIFGNIESGAILMSRAYVYTWVTEYNEEGPPSPPTTVQAWTNSVWTLGLFQPPSDDQGVLRNIMKTRIYRTVTGQEGSTAYFFIAEQAVTLGTYTDTATDDAISFNNQLLSALWSGPPEGLMGLRMMQNGVVVGFKANELWFCEPYRPHAWPSTYVLTTEFPIVGIGVTGQSVIACTEGYPTIVSGINPANMSQTKVHMPEPCTSRGGIISTDQGVFYPSTHGIIYVQATGQATNATEVWMSREKWAQLVPQAGLRSIKLASSYFSYSTVAPDAQRGFTLELAADAQSFSIWPQPGGHRIGFNKMTAPGDLDVVNLSIDPWTGIGLIIQNGGVYYYDFTDTAPTAMVYKWRSKAMTQNNKKNYAAFRVYFDIPSGTPALNPVRKSVLGMTVDGDMYGVARVFADDVLVTARELRTSGELMRVASGFKGDVWKVEIEGRVSILNVQFATSIKELAGV